MKPAFCIIVVCIFWLHCHAKPLDTDLIRFLDRCDRYVCPTGTTSCQRSIPVINYQLQKSEVLYACKDSDGNRLQTGSVFEDLKI